MAGATGEPVGRQAVTRLPKVLVRQLLLLVPLGVDVAVQALAGRLGSLGWFYAGGLVLVLAVTAVAALSRRLSLPPLVVAAIPVVDLAAIGLMRLVPDGNGLGILAVLPAMWLAADHRMRGVGVSFVATLVLVSLPSVAYYGSLVSVWSRALMMPTIAVMCAATVAGTVEVWVRQNKELESQGRRLEEALAEVTANRRLNDAIVSTVDVGLLALDRNGAYRATNPRHKEFMALTFPEGHAGRAGQTGQAYAEDRVTALTSEEQPTLRAMRGESFADMVMWVGRDPAEQKALSVSATPLLDPSGEFDGAVLAYHDVTDLVHALKVKDDFVASVSHELRTPLTSILGFLEMVMEDESVTPSVRAQLDVVRRNSVRLLGLVTDLLLTAQVDEGRLALDLSTVDAALVVEQALADLAPQAAAAGIAVHRRIPGPQPVRTDSARLRQVVDNLMSNALKYTPAGGDVTVSLAADDHELTLTVSDTGMGIAPEDQRRLFTRFYRTSEAESRAIQGVGLGLAITKSIVEAHGGRIEVDSDVGRGSTFRVTLPLGDAAQPGGSSTGPAMHAVPTVTKPTRP
jgi:signal transduction histidine kinase